MFKPSIEIINEATKIVIVQAENPDGDSLGSSLALEELLAERGKEVSLYCAIDVPKYLRYVTGWDRVTNDWPRSFDLAIIVDTTAETLLVKTLKYPGVRHSLETHPVLVLDHHSDAEDEFSFQHTSLIDSSVVSTGELIYKLASEAGWDITPIAAENMLISMLSDSLGLTTQNVTAETYQHAANLTKLGASPSVIEERRRDYMRKPADILSYKGDLIKRIEYSLEGELATVHIPWEDIQEYSDRYNPSVLVLDEMRLVEGVRVACAVKTYPDGKLTGKLRCNIPVAGTIAGYFGGGGHGYSAGFKVYESYDKIMQELVTATKKALDDYDTQTP